MSSPGEIQRLTEIAPLDVGLITNIGTAHIEFFSRRPGRHRQGQGRAGGGSAARRRSGCIWPRTPGAAGSLSSPGPATRGRWPWARAAPSAGKPWRSLGPRGERFRFRTPEGDRAGAAAAEGRGTTCATPPWPAPWPCLLGFDPEAVAAGPGARWRRNLGGAGCTPLRDGGWLLDEILQCESRFDPRLCRLPAGAGRRRGGGGAGLHAGAGGGSGAAPPGDRRGAPAGRPPAGLGLRRPRPGPGPGLRTRGARPSRTSRPSATTPAGLSAIPAGARILVKGSLYWRAERVVRWLLDRAGTVRSAEILG